MKKIVIEVLNGEADDMFDLVLNALEDSEYSEDLDFTIALEADNEKA